METRTPKWRELAVPGLFALEENREHEIQEARRLLYVGMTRAKDRLVLTRAGLRAGRPTGGDPLSPVLDRPRPSPSRAPALGQCSARARCARS